jgi:FkbM family methyltransferase
MKLVNNLRTVLSDPEILRYYCRWTLSKVGLHPPHFEIRGARIGGFPNFSSYLGAVRNKLTDEEIEFIAPRLSDAKVVLDVGANFGAFAIPFSQIARDAHIYAFEPNPNTAEALRANLQLNGINNVTVIESAVTDTDCELVFSDTRDPATNRIIEGEEGGIRIRARSLTSFCIEYEIDLIDFLKIDVEGAEIDVLRGANDLFDDNAIRGGLIEVCPNNLREFDYCVGDLVGFFNDKGFEMVLIGKNSHNQIDDKLVLENAGFFPKLIDKI